MQNNNETTNALFIHLSSFLGYLFPFAGVIIPLILWQTKKGNSDFIDKHGKAAVNFNITFSLAEVALIFAIILSVLGHIFSSSSLPFVFIIATFFVLELTRCILIIRASLKAQKGELYSYPFTINFIK